MAGELDRETRSYYVITVAASDRGVTPSPLEGTTTVNVTVTDANDNAPVFSKAEYSFSVTETETQSELVGVLLAEDKDAGSNAKVTYTLLTPNGQ